MGRSKGALTVSILMLAFLAGSVRAESADEYWPAWRGPRASGVAPAGKPPLTWSETENIKWKVPVPGEGTSSPIVWADKILFLTAIKTDRVGTPTQAPVSDANAPVPFHGGQTPKNVYKFDLVCLDRATGRILWQRTAREEVPHEATHPNHGFASYSPVTDGTCVWVSFGSRGIHCYDLNGEHKWSRDLGRMTIKMAFGEGSSPALAGDGVYFVGREGTTQVIRNAERFEILATNKLDDKFDASPAIAGNELFLKGKQHLYCIGLP